MRIVFFEKKAGSSGSVPGGAIRRSLLTEEDLSHLHKPWALKAFALLNVAAALYYGALGSYGVVSIMFFDSALGARVNFPDMIDLLQRSLWHNMSAGVALIADHLMQGFTQIMRNRNPERPKPLNFDPPGETRL